MFSLFSCPFDGDLQGFPRVRVRPGTPVPLAGRRTLLDGGEVVALRVLEQFDHEARVTTLGEGDGFGNHGSFPSAGLSGVGTTCRRLRRMAWSWAISVSRSAFTRAFNSSSVSTRYSLH